MRTLLLLVPLGVLGLAVHAAWQGWGVAPGQEMGWHGLIAMLLGIFFSLALAGVLVGLMIHSWRRGLDQ